MYLNDRFVVMFTAGELMKSNFHNIKERHRKLPSIQICSGTHTLCEEQHVNRSDEKTNYVVGVEETLSHQLHNPPIYIYTPTPAGFMQ